ARAGSRYGFSLDGGPPLADPRAESQPDGVQGLSEVVDHDAFVWHDAAWRGRELAGSVLYECHVGTFSTAGTFDAMVRRLPHLVDLGVDAVELMPVASFPGRRGWGYDGVCLYAPHTPYGGPDGLKRLVDACHGAGLAVVLDVVYNHMGPGSRLHEFGPYLTDEHRTAWGQAMNFEGRGSDEVRRFVVDNACMWVRDYHVDGLRLDAVHAITDRSALHVVEQLASEVGALAESLGSTVTVIAESDLNDPRFVRPPGLGGYGCDAAWADDWHHALHAVLTGERDGYYEDFGELDQLAKSLAQAWVYDGRRSTFRGAIHGRPATGVRPHQFVVATQNHDQVGNRARGERLAHLTTPGRVKVAAALLLTSAFTPMLFQGEEWAASSPFQYFTDHDDPETARAVTEGRRREFEQFEWGPDEVPDPQDPRTFERSRLRWDELGRADHAEVLEWYRTLLSLRRAHASLREDAAPEVRVDVEAATLVVARGELEVLVNLGPGPWHATAGGEVLTSSDPLVQQRCGELVLPPDAVAIRR
ncbi:MAG TPA: malto-oligosyltrehalose trehalohydrolase, partial [Acidimicrobiales bacterium]|nr:malto-oligosyltrehalose trehalohydrolase [Acidimicrobiales bacterium]